MLDFKLPDGEAREDPCCGLSFCGNIWEPKPPNQTASRTVARFLHVKIFVFADTVSGALLDQLDERVLPESVVGLGPRYYLTAWRMRRV